MLEYFALIMKKIKGIINLRASPEHFNRNRPKGRGACHASKAG